MTNQEIEKMFGGRFIIKLTKYDAYTFAPLFNFFDKKYQKEYTIECNSTDYEKFKIEYLKGIVEQLIEVREEKINIILDENENKCGNSNTI